jgi:hypothetical protein
MACSQLRSKGDELILPSPKISKWSERKKHAVSCLQCLLHGDLIPIVLSYEQTIQFDVLRRIGQKGKEDGQLNYPANICVSDTELFVADSLNNRIQVFDQTTGRFLRKSNFEINCPTSLAKDNYNLFVGLCEPFLSIHILNLIDLHLIRSIDVKECGSIHSFCSINDSFYIADRYLGSIAVASKTDGKLTKTIKTIGDNGQKFTPFYCRSDGQELLVCSRDAIGDLLHSIRICTGEVIRTYRFLPTMKGGSRAAIFHGDQVISCANEGSPRLVLFDREEGTIVLQRSVKKALVSDDVARFVDLAVNAKNELFVSDANNGRIVVFE